MIFFTLAVLIKFGKFSTDWNGSGPILSSLLLTLLQCKIDEVLFKQIPGTGHKPQPFVPTPSVNILLKWAVYDYRKWKFTLPSQIKTRILIINSNRHTIMDCIWVYLSGNKIWHNSLMCTPRQNQASLKIDSRCIMFSNNPSTTNISQIRTCCRL